jgi:nucleotide-binding universal stress UspA family protein
MTQADVQAHIQLKNILIATDFSPDSESTAPFATELARHSTAKIYALHVRPRAIKSSLPRDSWKDQDKTYEIEVERLRHLLGTSQVIQEEVLVREGDVWANVLDVMVEHDVDLVVIGTTEWLSGCGNTLGDRHCTQNRLARDLPDPDSSRMINIEMMEVSAYANENANYTFSYRDIRRC